MRAYRLTVVPVLSALLFAAAAGSFQTTSLLGRKLYALPDSDRAVASAEKQLAAHAGDPKLALQLSKAQAAKRMYVEAIAADTKALAVSSQSADLYTERGHRKLGLRQFKEAQADLEHAVQLDPKSLDAHYHLGLAHYFQGDYVGASQSLQNALNLADNPDSTIDCAHWLYVSLRRAGRPAEAAKVLARITPDIKNKEPHLFFYLQLLHFYQGKLTEAQLLPPPPSSPDDTESELSFNTINYALGNWKLYNDHQPEAAKRHFERVVQGTAWNSWGFIGSELQLHNGFK